jgi:hypothetical protein
LLADPVTIQTSIPKSQYENTQNRREGDIMEQNRSSVRIVVLLLVSVGLSIAVSSMLQHGASHAGGGCVSSLAEGAEATSAYESRNIGWPVTWLSITNEGCFAERTRTVHVHAEGLLVTAAASVLAFGLMPGLWLLRRVSPAPAH